MTVIERLPAGLFGKGTESFNIENEPYTSFRGTVTDFENTPECRIELYTSHMKSDPRGEKAMEKMTGSKNDRVKVRQWMMCRFGGLDNTPDIDGDDRIQEAEYVPCSKRGTCPFEGAGCCTVEVYKGVFLSKAELAVARLLLDQDKIIADRLHISPETVKTHMINIRRKTGSLSRAQLVHWATNKGII